MIWKLNGAIIDNKTAIIIYGKQSISIEKCKYSEEVLNFLRLAEKGIEEDNLLIYNENSRINVLIKALKKRSLFIKFENTYVDTVLDKSYYFLNYFLGNQYNIVSLLTFNKHITILGCGGVGANVSLNLLLAGFLNLTLIDYDVVEHSNLNRQFPLNNGDVGELKVDALRKHLLSYVPNAQIAVINKQISSTGSLLDILHVTDLIVCGIDTPPIKSQLFAAEAAYTKDTPIIFSGVGYESIMVGPFLTTNQATGSYIKRLKGLDDDCINTNPITGSLPSTNAILSSIVSNEIIGFFYKTHIGISINKQVVINPFNLGMKVIEYYES